VSFVVRRARPAAAVAVAVLSLTATSCGFGGSDAGGDGESAANASIRRASGGDRPAQSRTGSGGQAQELPAPGDLANFSCTESDGGVWKAEGDISNSTDQPMVYTVTVVTLDGNEISGEETAEVVVKPDEATSFDLPAVAEGPADACLPRLVRSPR
jgi:hypothetical protein